MYTGTCIDLNRKFFCETDSWTANDFFIVKYSENVEKIIE